MTTKDCHDCKHGDKRENEWPCRDCTPARTRWEPEAAVALPVDGLAQLRDALLTQNIELRLCGKDCTLTGQAGGLLDKPEWTVRWRPYRSPKHWVLYRGTSLGEALKAFLTGGEKKT